MRELITASRTLLSAGMMPRVCQTQGAGRQNRLKLFRRQSTLLQVRITRKRWEWNPHL